MARAITPTPKLDAKASRKFLRQISTDLKAPATYVSTPKLKVAQELIRKNARQKQK